LEGFSLGWSARRRKIKMELFFFKRRKNYREVAL